VEGPQGAGGARRRDRTDGAVLMMRRLAAALPLLAACAAPPLDTVSPQPAAAPAPDPIPWDGGAPDAATVHYGHNAARDPHRWPDAGTVGEAHTSTASAPDREWCDGTDNDGDGATDEGVTNRCGECGPTPADVPNAEDDDCDGRVDEGHLQAPCVGDADCLDPLSCQDGRCGMGCPGDACDLCARCLDTWHREGGQPLILDPGCPEACAVCAGFCAEVAGVCYRGACARDADEAACLPEFEREVHAEEWFGPDGVPVVAYVAVCVEP